MFEKTPSQQLIRLCVLAIAFTVLNRPAYGGEPQDDPNLDILRSAKLPTDGPGLLKVLESWAGNDQDCVQLDDLIQQLGDASFARRNEASRRIVALRHAALGQLEQPFGGESRVAAAAMTLGLEETLRASGRESKN